MLLSPTFYFVVHPGPFIVEERETINLNRKRTCLKQHAVILPDRSHHGTLFLTCFGGPAFPPRSRPSIELRAGAGAARRGGAERAG